jgi:hypothetical protein
MREASAVDGHSGSVRRALVLPFGCALIVSGPEQNYNKSVTLFKARK